MAHDADGAPRGTALRVVAGAVAAVLASLAPAVAPTIQAEAPQTRRPAQDATWTNGFAKRFAQGGPSTGAMFRYWLPGGSVDQAQVIREIEAIADAGYKGVEIAHVMDAARYP